MRHRSSSIQREGGRGRLLRPGWGQPIFSRTVGSPPGDLPWWRNQLACCRSSAWALLYLTDQYQADTTRHWIDSAFGSNFLFDRIARWRAPLRVGCMRLGICSRTHRQYCSDHSWVTFPNHFHCEHALFSGLFIKRLAVGRGSIRAGLLQCAESTGNTNSSRIQTLMSRLGRLTGADRDSAHILPQVMRA